VHGDRLDPAGERRVVGPELSLGVGQRRQQGGRVVVGEGLAHR
jgi:hypothetical protein